LKRSIYISIRYWPAEQLLSSLAVPETHERDGRVPAEANASRAAGVIGANTMGPKRLVNLVVIVTIASLAFDDGCAAVTRHFCYGLLISELADVMAKTRFHIARLVEAKLHQLVDSCLRGGPL
jgi:hypothetical protein